MTISSRILILSGSPLLAPLLAQEQVVWATSATEFMDLARRHRPDVVVIDLTTMGRSGMTTLERVMREVPTPVIVGGSKSQAGPASQLGAVGFVLMRDDGGERRPEELIGADLRAGVAVAKRVKVIRTLPAGPTTAVVTPKRPAVLERRAVIILGASTGGPDAIRTLLRNLGAECPAALIVVQHHPPGLTTLLTEQLHRGSPLPVREAVSGGELIAGAAVVVPGGSHLVIDRDGRMELNQTPAEHGHRPAVDVTMCSAAESFGSKAWGVVLTGMGSDGAIGMRAIRNVGGRTFAQEGRSCLVNGMPQRAVDTGAVEFIANPEGIGRYIRSELKMAWEDSPC